MPTLAGRSSGRCTLTARSDSGATSTSTASLTITAPAAIVALLSPPKVSRRLEPGTTAGPALRRPTHAAPIASGRTPQAFEIRTRIRLPPRLTRGIMRSVWLLNAAPSAEAGAAVQVPIQCMLSVMASPRGVYDERKLSGPRVSQRNPRRRFHAVRGRAVVHRGAGVARRRGRQDRESEDR